MPPSRNDNRNDNPTTPASTCPTCQQPFTPIRRQRYCTPACRQAAWRARHPQPRQPATVITPSTPRRSITVYECTDCGTRQLGNQWCHDCQQPCRRIDYGGRCPHCDEPIAISDITSQHPTTNQTT